MEGRADTGRSKNACPIFVDDHRLVAAANRHPRGMRGLPALCAVGSTLLPAMRGEVVHAARSPGESRTPLMVWVHGEAGPNHMAEYHSEPLDRFAFTANGRLHWCC